jgi:hypothetical protein
MPSRNCLSEVRPQTFPEYVIIRRHSYAILANHGNVENEKWIINFSSKIFCHTFNI